MTLLYTHGTLSAVVRMVTFTFLMSCAYQEFQKTLHVSHFRPHPGIVQFLRTIVRVLGHPWNNFSNQDIFRGNSNSIPRHYQCSICVLFCDFGSLFLSNAEIQLLPNWPHDLTWRTTPASIVFLHWKIWRDELTNRNGTHFYSVID